MSDSSSRRAATRAARGRQTKTGEPYAEARRRSSDQPDDDRYAGFGPHDFECDEGNALRCIRCRYFKANVRALGLANRCPRNPGPHPFTPSDLARARDPRTRCTSMGCHQTYDAEVHKIGGQVPPIGWVSRREHMVAAIRDGDQVTVTVLDAATGEPVASLTEQVGPAEALVDAYQQAGLIPGRPGSPAEQDTILMASLGRPDLLVNRLGYGSFSTIGHWSQWPDGTRRSPAWPAEREYIATARPLRPGQPGMQAITVTTLDGRVVADTITDEPIDPDQRGALDQALDQLGYTVRSGLWTHLPGPARYALARPGRLAERGWWTLARVRFLRDVTVSCPGDHTPRTYRADETATMNQHGSTGQEIDRDVWWSSTDIDYALIVPADAVEVLEVIERAEPMWADAELTAEQAIEALAGTPGRGEQHTAALADIPGVAETVTGWARAGLVLAHTPSALVVYTPAPERRPVGAIYQRHNGTWIYEAVINPDQTWRNQILKELPADPVAAAARKGEGTRLDGVLRG